MRSLYDLLELSSNATPDQLKTAYFKLIRILHPDRNQSIEDHQKFHQVQAAYETLSKPRERAIYDHWLADQKIKSDSEAYLCEEYILDSTDSNGDISQRLPLCRACGGEYMVADEDLLNIVDYAYFECENCSVFLKINRCNGDAK